MRLDALYLRDHEIGAQAALRAFRRAAGSHRRRPWGAELGAIAAEVREDVRTQQRILRARRVRRSRTAAVAVAVGERLGRLKPNGSLLRRTPLTDLVELEGLVVLVLAKRTGWRALEVAGGVEGFDLTGLVARADAQADRLRAMHEQAAVAALRPRSR